jgi:hypothetical protein
MKKVLLIIAVALVVFLSFGFYQGSKLQEIQITKNVTIKGSKKEVFEMIQYLNNFPKWSPFLAQDPGQKYRVEGIDGTVGAKYHWDGNGGDDLGYQEIMKIDTTTGFIGMQCDIQKPFVAKPTFEYSITETPAGVVVSQNFNVKSDLFSAFFMWLGNAKKGIEETNQQGLDLLKKAVEKS